VRDKENFAEHPVSLCSFGWSPRDQGSSPSKLALLPFCYRPSLKHSRTCDLGAKNKYFLCKALFHLHEHFVQQKPNFWRSRFWRSRYFWEGLRYTFFWLERPA
jgi:hypothetical protein